jgi:hypothetical protein
MSRNQERQLQRLLLVQPRVAVRGVVQAQVFVYKTFTTSSTLCDRVSGKLKMHAAQVGIVLLMDFECRRQF